MRTLGNGKVYANLSSIQICSIHGVSCLNSIILVFIVNKGKSSATTSVTIENNLNLFQWSKLFKLRFQFSLTGVQTQSENSDAFSWLRSIS